MLIETTITLLTIKTEFFDLIDQMFISSLELVTSISEATFPCHNHLSISAARSCS